MLIGAGGIECEVCCRGTDGTQLAPSLFNTFRSEQIIGFVSGPERNVKGTANAIGFDDIDGKVREHCLCERTELQSFELCRSLVAKAVGAEIGCAVPGLSRKCLQLGRGVEFGAVLVPFDVNDIWPRVRMCETK